MADSNSEKKPSKKELKKLAKKAEKAAKKAGGAAAGGGGDAKSASGAAAPAAPAPAPAGPRTYYLAHATETSLSTAKAAIAASVFGVAVKPASASASAALPFLHDNSAALLDSATGSPGGPLAFGGNAIVKALSLLSDQGQAYSAEADDWLEYERTALRPALAGGNAKKIAAALTTLSAALTTGGKLKSHLVGDTTTAADVSIVVTLIRSAKEGVDTATFPPQVQSYVTAQTAHQSFVEGLASVADLLPPPPFDYATNPSQMRAVTAVFATAIGTAFPEHAGADPVVQRCGNVKHGDYQCNAAMRLFGAMKKAGGMPPGINSPQDIARAILAAIPADNPAVESLELNGPGFILCRVRGSYLQAHMNSLLRDGVPRPPPPQADYRRCVVDFSSPNIAKEMHVGHLRSTIIGESVCRILEFTGHEVDRVNHVGDWGTQFGMLIQYLREEYPGISQGEEVNITDLTAFYKAAKARFDDDADFKEKSRLNVVDLQAHDPECIQIWQLLCDISRKEFDKVYGRLDITVKECGESFYNDKIPPVIEEFGAKGLLSVEEGGAKCIWVPKYNIPLMVQKSDGGYGYDSTDMAALKYRLHTLGAKRIICITDYSQADHFKMCFAAAEKIGWAEPGVHRLEHIGFGTVMGEDGKRFKTRSGETVRLVDLLDEAVRRQEEGLGERIEAGTASITREELLETASALGYGAVKYFDLRRNPTTNYVFSYDRMLDLKGNTAIYLLYAHARLESIISKGKAQQGKDIEELLKTGTIVIGHPSERNLALYLQMFADTMETTLEDLYPYHICDFLYSVATAASEFVTQCKVLGSPEMESRLLLCRATTAVMRQCFDLLGIRAVYRI